MEDKVKSEFKNPGSAYRLAPFWSWNEVMRDEEVGFQLKDFKEHGFGGAFAHPRLGMVTEYLSEDYFSAWKHALETCRENDMKLYMYDEDVWPSGFAGGLVPERDGDTIGTLAKYRITPAAAPEFSGEIIYAAEYDSSKHRIRQELTDIPKEEWGSICRPSGEVFVVYRIRPFSSEWTGGYPYTDLTNRKTTDLFLEITYEEYYKRFGADFSSLIPASFSDEANIHSEGLDTLPFTDHLEEKFISLNGYPLRKNLPAVYKNIEGPFDRPCEKVRYDYYYTLHELWIDNFVRPMSDWCEKHGIAWTGHDVEHQWPQAHMGRIAPSEQTTYEFRQWPGLDLLLCDHLRNDPTNFDKLEMYEIRSAANQFNKERTLCEAYGAGGWHSTLGDYKRLGDFLMVNGINFIVPHLSLYSYAGSRKRDCPQSFDYRQPWWNEFTEYADYFARTSYMLSSGKMEQRILLMNTTTSGYLVPAEEAEGTIDHMTDVHCIGNPDMSDFLSVLSMLADEQWDFDIGDEDSFVRNAEIKNGAMTVGSQSYKVIVISANMKNIRRGTAGLLLNFIKAGGRVVTTDFENSNAGEYIDGEKGKPETGELRLSWEKVSGADGLKGYLESHLEKYIVSDKPWRCGVAHMRRVLPDGRVCWFIVNHSMDTYESIINVKGKCASEWNLFDGSTRGIACDVHGESISFPIKLKRCESIMFVTDDAEPVGKSLPGAERRIRLSFDSARAEKQNMLSLDHVSIVADGKTYPELYFIEAAENLFKLRGFSGNPWKTGLQRRTDYMDMNSTFGEDSGFQAVYKFYVMDGSLPIRISAVVERPEMMSVEINGHKVEWEGEKYLIDPETGVFDISEYIKAGENLIVLSAKRFNVLCELEPILLLGEFGVAIEDGRFVIGPACEIGYGSWVDLGMPFYPNAVEYSFTAELDHKPQSAVITAKGCIATAVSVTVNGKYGGLLDKNGGADAQIANLMTPGKNTITLRVCGSFRNLYGPHLNYDDTMPYDFSFFDRGRASSADEYTFCSYGLNEEPILTVSE